MSSRRSPRRVAAARHWQDFVLANARLLDAAGVPPAATASIAAWDALLVHGHLPAEPGGWSVGQLTASQYESLRECAANYFHAGYEFYLPGALKPEDQVALRDRFG